MGLLENIQIQMKDNTTKEDNELDQVQGDLLISIQATSYKLSMSLVVLPCYLFSLFRQDASRTHTTIKFVLFGLVFAYDYDTQNSSICNCPTLTVNHCFAMPV